MPNVASHSADRGFTLIEVLVALAIAALALVAIFEGASAGMQSVERAQRTVAATRLAQAHMAEVGAVVPLAEGETGGTDSAGYRWQLRIRPAAAGPASADGFRGPVLYAVESIVSWGPATTPRSVRIQTLRLAGRTSPGRR